MKHKAIFDPEAKAWAVAYASTRLFSAMFTEAAAKRIATLYNRATPPADLIATKELLQAEGFDDGTIFASPIKTPQTHPEHHTVGHHYAGHSFETDSIQIYFCDSFDPQSGYWMTNISRPSERKNISTRAIDRTFMPAEDRGDHWWVSRWCTRYAKAEAPVGASGSSS